MYKALCFFTDLKDHDYAYRAGDIFPRKGVTVSEERLKELSSSNNRRGVPVIEKVKDDTDQPKESKRIKEEPFMNEPEPPDEPIEVKPKKRGRKKSAD